MIVLTISCVSIERDVNPSRNSGKIKSDKITTSTQLFAQSVIAITRILARETISHELVTQSE